MEIKIINDSKNEIEIEINNITVAEILRVYLNKDSEVIFAAWKQEHPTKTPVMKVKTKSKTAKKAINDAVAQITKDLGKIESDFKKLK